MDVYHPSSTVPLMSFDQSNEKSHNVQGTVHIFDVNPLFELNLTFLVFSHSGWCKISKNYICKAQNEALFIQQSKDLLNFVFFKTMVNYLIIAEVVMFKQCNYSHENYFKKNPMLKYLYQVLSAGAYKTHSDNSHQVLKRDGQLHFSNICYRNLDRVHKYEQHYFLNENKFEHTLLLLPMDNTKSFLFLKFETPLNLIL